MWVYLFMGDFTEHYLGDIFIHILRDTHSLADIRNSMKMCNIPKLTDIYTVDICSQAFYVPNPIGYY